MKNTFIVIMVFVGIFGFREVSAGIDSCVMGYKYSNLTGKLCASEVEEYIDICINLTQDIKYRERDKNVNGPVNLLQFFLKDQKYLNGKIDGIFGPATLKAVKSFQQSNGMKIDGFVNLKTRSKIKKITCSRYPNMGDLIEYNAVLSNYDYTLIPGYKYDKLPSEFYTKKSWAEYQEAVKLYTVTEDNMQEEIDEASNNLKIAQSKLIKKGNLNSYNAILMPYTDKASCEYTEESWSSYKNFLSQNMVTEEDSQEKIDKAVSDILVAQKLLKNKTGLTICPI